ncbi:MTRF1L release factor glutamine methyltransferase isoform X6 [Harpia harpyja]|uniref:MTRF1L release factor glutamine methyltransferase isoform X6 n=1 Tax=Harpia harpyja TaxID=202280 RepID=UPI0022B146F9|nr:MTRF1L release factor glutamine methyltransferase isoform X6 [Harpia harpyja]
MLLLNITAYIKNVQDSLQKWKASSCPGSRLFNCGGRISETREEFRPLLPGSCPSSCDPGDWLWLWSNCSESVGQNATGSAKQLLVWGPIDFIVSNPPYVFHEDMASLDAEILCYEDLDALDGGDDGMRVIKTILALAPSLLKDSGSVFLEVDPRHPDMVENWLQAHPNLLLILRAIHKDFCGKPRFLHIQKQSR